ncbi:uncharacterized protein LOC109848434 isoform X2 [Asparagus officinalis]|uniref:uncharacterized protein LOC109848434 isoform X2 n=1 Tax=Asparagus officinalis TaxID=4686 RepID=UPI00098E3A68|nr:uncharacterized protein LOC109848434 isoform X2 [Asparagus officinalis]
MENFAVISAAVLLLLSCLLPSTLADPVRSGNGNTITGRVKVAGTGSKDFGLLAKISNIKVILNGGQSVLFVRADGYFSLYTTLHDMFILMVTPIEILNRAPNCQPRLLISSGREPPHTVRSSVENQTLASQTLMSTFGYPFHQLQWKMYLAIKPISLAPGLLDKVELVMRMMMMMMIKRTDSFFCL